MHTKDKLDWHLIKEWRNERGYTTKDWNMYASARTDQMYFFSACVGVVAFIAGYVVGGI